MNLSNLILDPGTWAVVGDVLIICVKLTGIGIVAAMLAFAVCATIMAGRSSDSERETLE